ncbi:hypothetical protein Ahy_B02g060550 isoform A [Arachis hypogaea]|uniref:Uncharacterized protein n=1 Tax=Arachis hypogaea TaxID=3818 RepID=A0A445AIV8_ARAHY|nr:hypothetical protein Ahy_B02g060550 isoform A [Arachis hypogaea]
MKISVHSHFEVSKIHINSQLKEMEAFKSRLVEPYVCYKNCLVMHQQLLQSGLAKSHHKADSLLKDPLGLLEPLLLLMLVKKTGITNHVETTQRKWILPLRIDMSVASVATPMEVLHSGMNNRFKVEVMVYDGTGSIRLLL